MIWLFAGIGIGVVVTIAVGYLCYRAYRFGHSKGFAAGGKVMHDLIQSNVKAELAKQREHANQMNTMTARKDLQA